MWPVWGNPEASGGPSPPLSLLVPVCPRSHLTVNTHYLSPPHSSFSQTSTTKALAIRLSILPPSATCRATDYKAYRWSPSGAETFPIRLSPGGWPTVAPAPPRTHRQRREPSMQDCLLAPAQGPQTPCLPPCLPASSLSSLPSLSPVFIPFLLCLSASPGPFLVQTRSSTDRAGLSLRHKLFQPLMLWSRSSQPWRPPAFSVT